MAVKFSQFTQETVAANVTRLVGYTATGDLNIQIPPANLDTTYTFATAQDGNNVDLTLTGTKTGTANTTEVLQFTAGAGVTLTSGTDALTIAATGAVSSVDETTPGTSSGVPIVVNPTTGAVLIQSMSYAGTTNIGHVPAGGTASTFLRGDGTWVTPSGGFSNFDIAGDTGSETVNSGDTVTFTGGTNITTAVTATDTVTINLDTTATLWTLAGGDGAGTSQIITPGNIATIKENTSTIKNSVQVGGGIQTKANATDELLLDQTAELVVTMINPGSGNLLYIDGDYQPIINLTQGFTYEFNQDAATNSGHPLEIGEVLDGATPYATGIQYYGSASANTLTPVDQDDYVTNSATYSGGSGTARVRLRITQNTPALYYYCSNHSGMGGSLVALNDRYTGLSALGSGSTFALNFATATTFTATANANATFNFSNAIQGQVVDLIVSGVYTLEFAETGSTFNRVGSVEYDSTTNNIIQIICTDDAPGAKVYHYSVATFQSDTTPG